MKFESIIKIPEPSKITKAGNIYASTLNSTKKYSHQNRIGSQKQIHANCSLIKMPRTYSGRSTVLGNLEICA